MRDTNQQNQRLESHIDALLADPQYRGHPLREALQQLVEHQREQIAQLEKLTSISDGYQSVLNTRYQTLTQRHQKQMRQLQKIVKISDHYQHMLQDLNESLKIASTQDPLTGLFNRRLMLDRLQNEAALARRRQTSFSVLLLDVDHFKSINDSWGHNVGDRALVFIANALSLALRNSDICARWGGEEFLVLLPDTAESGAMEIAERLRCAISRLRVPELPASHQLTISIGVAYHRIESSIEETIKCADDALYAAKAGGRNRVMRGLQCA